MIVLLYFFVWAECSYSIFQNDERDAPADLDPDIPSHFKREMVNAITEHTSLPDDGDVFYTLAPSWLGYMSSSKPDDRRDQLPLISDSPDFTADERGTQFTPAWVRVTGEYVFFRADVAAVAEMKRDLGASDSHPKEFPLIRSSNVYPTVAVTSQLIKFQFCDDMPDKMICDQQRQMEDLGYNPQTEVFPSHNLLDGDTKTLCSLLGSDGAPTWIALILPENIYIGHVIMHVSNSVSGGDKSRLIDQLRVSLEWFDMRIACDPVDSESKMSRLTDYEDDYQLTSSCGGYIASRIFIQIDRYKGKSIPINLSLSEIEIMGNPSGHPRLTIKSPPMNFNNSIVNIYFKSNFESKTFESQQHEEGLKTGEQDRSNIEHVLAISIDSTISKTTIFPFTVLLTLGYHNGLVSVSLENCGFLKEVQTTHFDAPLCVSDETLPPCSWSLLFLEETFEVYIDKRLAGIFSNDADENCSDCVKQFCRDISFQQGMAIGYYGTTFEIDVMEVWDNIRKPKVLSSKSDRHDFCYHEERTMIGNANCWSLVTETPQFLNTTSGTLVYGFEALGVSELLEEEFMELYSDVLTGEIVEGSLHGLYEDYFDSAEYLQEVEDVFADRLTMGFLETTERLLSDQKRKHSTIHDYLIIDYIDKLVFEVSTFFEEIWLITQGLLPVSPHNEPNARYIEKRNKVMDLASTILPLINKGGPGDVARNMDMSGERAQPEREPSDEINKENDIPYQFDVSMEEMGVNFINNIATLVKKSFVY